MFKPTVNNLYGIMKDMTVKPSIYKKTGQMYPVRTFRLGFCYRTILNIHKDFTIEQPNSNQLVIDLTEYKYSIWIPSILNQIKYTVKKYA